MMATRKRRRDAPEWIDTLIPHYIGCGNKKLCKLADKFPSEEALRAAQLEDLVVPPIGRDVAGRVRDFLDGKLPMRSDGRSVIEMWNTKTNRKCPYPNCPTSEENAKQFMQKYPYYERYDGQDQEYDSGVDAPDRIADDQQLTREAYNDFCQKSVAVVHDGKQELENTFHRYKYKLQLGPLYEEGASGSAARSSTAPLFEALSHANMAYGGSMDARKIQAVMPTGVRPESLINVLEAAADVLGRPIKVFIPSQEDQPHEDQAVVYLVDGTGSPAIPSDTPPIRLGHVGGMTFAPIFLEDDIIPAAPPQYTSDDDEGPNTQLPEMKARLGQILESTLESVEDIQECLEIDLDSVHEKTSGFRSRLLSADGLTAALLGTNGGGKSTLINLMLLNSSIDQQTYKEMVSRLAEDGAYTPEAILYAEPDEVEKLPSLKALQDTDGEMILPSNNPTMRIILMARQSSTTPFPVSNNPSHSPNDMMSLQIKKFCETKQFEGFENFLLPCGKGSITTTIMGTCVRYGKIVQLRIQCFSCDELKAQALEFIVILRKYLDEGYEPDELDTELEDDLFKELLDGFRKYSTLIKGDPTTSDDIDQTLQDLKQLASDRSRLPSNINDVRLSDKISDLIKVPQTVYIGTGNLTQDRAMVCKLIDRASVDGLQSLITKKIHLYDPTTLLEGGTGIVDLPGTNTLGATEVMHTMKGVEEAGVIFVVLQKFLGADESSVNVMKSSGVMKRVLRERSSANPVVFLFNRENQERGNLHALEEKLGSDEEKQVQEEMKEKTQKIWKEQLTIEANKMFKNGELNTKLSATEIQEIVDRTLMRCVYPLLHTAWKYHKERAAAHPEIAERVFANSNMDWLLGLLEKLNRDDIINELYTMTSKTLPEAKEKVMACINDAQHFGDTKLPKGLVQMATNMLTGTRNEGFTRTVELLNEAVRTMCVKEFRDRVCVTEVDQFCNNNEEFKRCFDSTRERQNESWKKIKRAIGKTNSLQPLLNFISIRNKGKNCFPTTGLSIHSLVFGKDRLQLDFAPLHAAIKQVLGLMKDEVIDLVLEVIDERFKMSKFAEDGDIAHEHITQLLRETFQMVDLLPRIEKRFGNEFFSRKQTKNDLIHGRIPEFFLKLATEAATVAIDAQILRPVTSKEVTPSKEEIISFFEEEDFTVLEDARSRWEEAELANCIGKFLEKQFKELEKDLTSKPRKGGQQGLMESLLRAFFTHVVQTEKAQTDDNYVELVKEKAKELSERANELHNLWAQVRVQVDPEELGRQAARYFEYMRGQQACAASLREYKLHKPSRNPVKLVICQANVQQQFHVAKHTFLDGSMDKLASMSNHLKKFYKLNLLKRDAGKPDEYVYFKDMFSATALLCWKDLDLCQAAGLEPSNDRYTEDQKDEAIKKISVHLRALAATQIERHFQEKPTRQAVSSKALHMEISDYLKMIKMEKYAGDLFCLWAIAKQVSSNIRVWLPGDNRCILIPGALDINIDAFNMIIAREPGSMDVETPHGGTKLFFPVFKYRAARHKSVAFSDGDNTVMHIDAVGNMSRTPPRNQSAQRAWSQPGSSSSTASH